MRVSVFVLGMLGGALLIGVAPAGTILNLRGTVLFALVMVAGAGGAFVSSLRRLYGFQDIFARHSYVRLFRRLDF